MFARIKKIFIGLLTRIVNGTNHKNVYSWVIRNVWFNLLLLIHILMNTIKDCYPFVVELDRCAGICNTFNDLSNKL